MSKSLSADTKNVFKNMLIGIATTVAGATIIYFLGFNNKKPSFNKLEREEITTDAWKTYVTVENIYTKNTASLLRDVVKLGGFSPALQQTTKESEKFQTSLNDLIATDGVDGDMVSLLKKRLDNEKKGWPETEKFYKGLDELGVTGKKENWTRQQTLDTMAIRVDGFVEHLKGVLNRSVTDIEELAKLLTERYDLPFDINDFLIVQAIRYKKDIFSLYEREPKTNEAPPEQPAEGGKDAGNTGGEPVKATKQYLTGKWDAAGAIVSLGADGKASWSIPVSNTEAKGTWQFKNNQLIINIKRHPVSGKDVEWVFDLSNVMTNSCVIMKTTTPFTMYNLVRR